MKFLHARAEHYLATRETDAGSGPVKAAYVEQLRNRSSGVLSSWCPCGLHQQNLNVGRIARTFFHALMTAQHSHASLIQVGNFWLRCLLVLEKFVADPNHVVIHRRAPRPEDIALARLAMAWFFPAGRSSSPAKRAIFRANEDKWKDEWVAMMNGGVHMSAHTGRCVIVHCCHGCCRDDAHARARIRMCLIKVNYRRRPPPAQLTEWTRVRDCAKFHALNIVTAGVGKHVFEAAASEIRGDAVDIGANADAEAITSYLKETDFSMLANKRVRVVRNIVMKVGGEGEGRGGGVK